MTSADGIVVYISMNAEVNKPQLCVNADPEPQQTMSVVRRPRKTKRLRFSAEEEANVREGMRIHGNSPTRWKDILFNFAFDPSRTAGDIKDKWRNLIKSDNAAQAAGAQPKPQSAQAAPRRATKAGDEPPPVAVLHFPGMAIVDAGRHGVTLVDPTKLAELPRAHATVLPSSLDGCASAGTMPCFACPVGGPDAAEPQYNSHCGAPYPGGAQITPAVPPPGHAPCPGPPMVHGGMPPAAPMLHRPRASYVNQEPFTHEVHHDVSHHHYFYPPGPCGSRYLGAVPLNGCRAAPVDMGEMGMVPQEPMASMPMRPMPTGPAALAPFADQRVQQPRFANRVQMAGMMPPWPSMVRAPMQGRPSLVQGQPRAMPPLHFAPQQPRGMSGAAPATGMGPGQVVYVSRGQHGEHGGRPSYPSHRQVEPGRSGFVQMAPVREQPPLAPPGRMVRVMTEMGPAMVEVGMVQRGRPAIVDLGPSNGGFVNDPAVCLVPPEHRGGGPDYSCANPQAGGTPTAAHPGFVMLNESDGPVSANGPTVDEIDSADAEMRSETCTEVPRVSKHASGPPDATPLPKPTGLHAPIAVYG